MSSSRFGTRSVAECGFWKEIVRKECNTGTRRQNEQQHECEYACSSTRSRGHSASHGSCPTRSGSSISFRNPTSRSGCSTNTSMEGRLQVLESILTEEREGRKNVQLQLDNLQSMIDSHFGKEKKQ
eukprot:TRINITY_DN22372_c0_g1_i1.p2 TRINITY_DN22372_c0_g1~~TRINITY_DN22372_c0_g1_i1.p2  ORF type:complete len:126 (+),score=16.50 TRINITY_DN22372_c0_g1_i1:70-447(+)